MKGFFSKKNTEAKKRLKEYRVEKTEIYKEGNEFGLEIFKDIKFVDTKSKTIGKGFAGAMKRHGFKGQRASHGAHKVHRKPGAVGQCATPSRIFKGKKLPGRMGNQKTTILNLEVVQTDTEKELLLIKGSVPGPNGSTVLIRDAVKGAV